jgi:hypothetical protein
MRGHIMSQHLITDFIHRAYQVQPFQTNKLIATKLVKYKQSTRQNNSSPEDIEESIHYLKPIKASKNIQSNVDDSDEQTHIDIII